MICVLLMLVFGAGDASPGWDVAELYPLLRSAAAGEAPDWAALREAPGAHVGQLYIVEGEFLAGGEADLAREGDWGGSVSRWAVRYGETPDDVATLLLVHPDGEVRLPRPGERVSIPARFFKMWQTLDQANQPWTFPLLVGRVPGRWLAGSASDTGGAGASPWPMVGAVAVLALLVVLMRRALRGTPHRGRVRRVPGPEGDYDGPAVDDAPAATDPADALEKLARRHEPPPP